MENKMKTSLGNAFSIVENQVSQYNDQTVGSIAETLVIHFDQERFEQLFEVVQAPTYAQAQEGQRSQSPSGNLLQATLYWDK